MAKKKAKTSPGTIVVNKKATFDYFVEERYEAGMQLQGWEVKSLRQGKVQLRDSYVTFIKDEAYLVGALITPLHAASTHVVAEPTRPRKLLLHEREIDKLKRHSEADGYTIAALNLHWKKQFIKCEIALVKGKKHHDKREASKERDWNKQKERLMKHKV